MISSSKIAKLANLPLEKKEEKLFTQQITSVLDIVSKLQKVDTKNVIPTSQVTGQINVTREDEIDTKRMFTQKEALSNAHKQDKGYFIIPAIFE